MKAHALPIPGIVLGAYPEHRTPDRARGAGWSDRVPPVFSKS